MDDNEIPVGFILLSKLASGKTILNESLLHILKAICFFVVGALLFIFVSKLISIIFILPSLFMIGLFLIELQRKKTIMNTIAVNLGHPWVEEEHDVDTAEVAYKTLEKWEVLPRKGRVVKNFEGTGLLIGEKGNENFFEVSKPLLGANFQDENNEKIESELIKWLNMALAIRDAQNNVEDEIENARVREEEDGIDIERIWPKTNPGEFNVKPGAIFRKFSKGKK
ncbi:MAG: hypothetical protein CMB48_01955 [Euryarchaeota archaeon]|nr:hypothetical protein [Euryarchaeota archaeon]